MAVLFAAVFALVTAAVVGFQVALALGAPWGAYAMGGAYSGRMPGPMRIAAIAQAAVLTGLAVVVLSAAEVTAPNLVGQAPWLVWVPVVFSAIAVVLNASTRSIGERRLWLPVTLVMLATSLAVALS